MNLFDAGTVVLLVVAVILGFRSGALPQVGGLIGALAGGGIAIVALPYLDDVLGTLDGTTRAFAVLLGLLLAIGLGEGLGSAAGRAVGHSLGSGVLGAVDRVAGGVAGAAQALLIVWLAGGLLAGGPMPRLAGEAQNSVAVRGLSAVLPPPTEIAVGLGRLLDASGLPEVFIGLEPVPAPPVDPPADPEVRRIAAAAERSTAKVQAASCGAIATGSGFVVDRGYVVTNAHVVAGGRGVRVTADGDVWDAVPVLFDADLDIAVLWVDGLDAPVLEFADEDPRRGVTGAALGFPGGGGLAVIPSAVTGRYDAQGRDIYGDDRVVRPILELRAEVERGSSGGPLVLPDGTVGGVIFAESRSDEDVGYALAASRVAEIVAAGIGETDEVATGDCLR